MNPQMKLLSFGHLNFFYKIVENLSRYRDEIDRNAFSNKRFPNSQTCHLENLIDTEESSVKSIIWEDAFNETPVR